MLTKVCGTCKQDLPIESYYQRSGSTLPRSDCKQCMREKDKKWAKNHPETYRNANRESTKAWRNNNPTVTGLFIERER